MLNAHNSMKHSIILTLVVFFVCFIHHLFCIKLIILFVIFRDMGNSELWAPPSVRPDMEPKASGIIPEILLYWI